MLGQISPVEVLPLSVTNNCFRIRLSDLEVDEFYDRMVPKNLYALVYRKGADPRCNKITETIFADCDICCNSRCNCDRREPITVECPPTYFWTCSKSNQGIDYVFELDKRVWNYTPGQYVVDIIAPGDERRTYSDLPAGVWDSEGCSDISDACCHPKLHDRTCKTFEFCIDDCYFMNVDVGSCSTDGEIVVFVPIEDIEMPTEPIPEPQPCEK